MADNPQDKAQIIQMGSVSNPSSVSGQVWWDGTNLKMNISGTTYTLTHPVSSAWAISGVTPNRTYNAGAATLLTMAQTVGTILTDLQTSGYIS